MHENAGIEADDVPALMHEPAPPQVLDIAFELDSERSIVPGICQTAINVRAGEDESAALAERGNFVHGDDARLLGGAHRFSFSRPGNREEPGNIIISWCET